MTAIPPYIPSLNFINRHDGLHWELLADLTGEKRDRPNAYIELPKPVKTRYIKYEHVYVAAHNLAISDIRVFGREMEKHRKPRSISKQNAIPTHAMYLSPGIR